jgi:hypothetical protein
MDIKEKLERDESDPFNKILGKLSLGESDTKNVARRAIVFPLFTWLPLLIMTLIEGNALNPAIKISLLNDYSTFAKLFITLPLVFVAGKFIYYMTMNSIQQFIESGIITKETAGKFERTTNTYLKLQNSVVIQITILVFAIFKIVLANFISASIGDESSWKYLIMGESKDWTFGGYWYILVCMPILQFLLLRLFWRFIIWAWFLWKISRMKLNLVASDPDTSAGLGFLGTTQLSFGLLGFAQSSSLASEIANKAIYTGVSIDEFKITALVTIPLLVIIYISPLFFFFFKLLFLKLHGIWEFSMLTHQYSFKFENKWIRGVNPENEEFLGTGDIQSLADIGTASDVINNLRLIPMSIRVPIAMFLMIAIPFVPLLVLKYPVSEILKGVVGFVF